MNISGKRTSRLLSLSLTGSMLLGLMTTGVSAVEPAQDQTPQTTKTVTDAILYTVDADGNLEVLKGTDVGYHLNVTGSVDDILKEQNDTGRKTGPGSDQSYTVTVAATLDDEKLAAALASLHCVTAATPTSDACISAFEEGKPFTIIPEVQGNELDMDKMKAAVKSALLNQKKEIYLRNLSMEIYGDSKVMENIIKPICDLIIAYADADDFKASENSTDILAFFNVLRNPSYIYFKGTGTITFISGDTYNLFGNSIGIASNELSMIKKIEIENSEFITVENLTTFHTMESNAFLMYLGGYHNSSRAEFLKKIYENNPDIEYHHFGDIDAGGFYIFRRLKEATGIPFTPYKMDQTFLNENNKYWKPLTKNDIARLSSIAGREDMNEFKEISEYMLTNNCKLEQEAMH